MQLDAKVLGSVLSTAQQGSKWGLIVLNSRKKKQNREMRLSWYRAGQGTFSVERERVSGKLKPRNEKESKKCSKCKGPEAGTT